MSISSFLTSLIPDWEALKIRLKPTADASPPGSEAASVDLAQQGDPRSKAGTGVVSSTQVPLSQAIAASEKAAALLEFGFGRAPEGGLTAARSFAWAVPEDAALKSGARAPELKAVDEASLASQATRLRLLKYFKTAQVGELTSSVPDPRGNPVKLRYAAFLPPEGTPIKGVLHLVNGRTESMLKNAETAYAFREARAAGYALVMHDHRGQGFSDRLLRDPDKGYVQSFGDYVTDLHQVDAKLRELLAPRLTADARWSIAGHSMGGGIVARHAEAYPDHFGAAVLLSPMLGVETGLSNGVERVAAAALSFADFGEPDYTRKGAGWSPDRFEGNTLTGSRNRLELANWVGERYRALQLGSATNYWAHEAIEATAAMLDDASNLKKDRVIVIRSGQDRIVDTAQQDEVIAASGINLISYARPEGELPVGHELLQERDAIQHEVQARLLRVMMSGSIAV